MVLGRVGTLVRMCEESDRGDSVARERALVRIHEGLIELYSGLEFWREASRACDDPKPAKKRRGGKRRRKAVAR